MTFPGDYEDEDLMTLLVAKCVGVDNVRGGTWASALVKPDFPDKSLAEIMQELTDRSVSTPVEVEDKNRNNDKGEHSSAENTYSDTDTDYEDEAPDETHSDKDFDYEDDAPVTPTKYVSK